MSKQHLIAVTGGFVIGYFGATTLTKHQPFKVAGAAGYMLGKGATS